MVTTTPKTMERNFDKDMAGFQRDSSQRLSACPAQRFSVRDCVACNSAAGFADGADPTFHTLCRVENISAFAGLPAAKPPYHSIVGRELFRLWPGAVPLSSQVQPAR